MMNLLSTFFLLTSSASAVHSSPSSTRKYIRRMEFKPKSNDDPDTINFNFSIQSSKPPSNAQSVADALETFGSTLFDESAAYGHRFVSFEVDPLTTTSVSVAVARGSWRQLEEATHSSSYEAELILDKSFDLYASEMDEEEVKQFFLNGVVGLDLEGLLGEWTAVGYIPIATDAVEEVPVATTDAVEEAPENEPATIPTTAPDVVPVKPNPNASTVTAESAAVNVVDESAGNINSNVLGIFFAVVGGCLAAFVFAAFVQNRKRRKNNATATETSVEVDHIGDVNICEFENDKPKVTVGEWAAGLLPSKSNNDNTGSSPAAAATDIDRVLAELHDSEDSSFISAGSSGEDGSHFSGYTGMTGISDLNYQPKSKGDASTLEKVEEVKTSISFLDKSRGSLLRNTSLNRKKESFESDPSDSKGSSRTSQSMRKEESFESDYRDKSAMATLNLKKDMLNTDVGEDEKARTMSAQQNSEMLAQQRQVDKVRAATVKAKKRMKSIGSSPQKDGSQSSIPNSDAERDQLLPSPVHKSDDDHVSFEIV